MPEHDREAWRTAIQRFEKRKSAVLGAGWGLQVEAGLQGLAAHQGADFAHRHGRAQHLLDEFPIHRYPALEIATDDRLPEIERQFNTLNAREPAPNRRLLDRAHDKTREALGWVQPSA
ncbi:MAG: hypothetical protein IPI57_12215 [Candidatus Competibacteraceae bacterium]|nr:hypothetical protein [Candidatus Competibacteraceae bacterium]MBK7542519.1 hypothetical protein [Candidatus Competibacteraceae bacterium]